MSKDTIHSSIASTSITDFFGAEVVAVVVVLLTRFLDVGFGQLCGSYELEGLLTWSGCRLLITYARIWPRLFPSF